MTSVRIHQIARSTTALGPGNRTAIWFQGCERRCKGCMSPDTRPLNGGSLWHTSDLANTVCGIDNIEGITISGGEPFLQIDALHELLTIIRKRKNLGVILYTGYTMEQLRQMIDSKVDQIITSFSDIIIDGEYIDELNDGGSLKGSANQTVNFITDRYLPYKSLYEGKRRDIQILIDNDRSLLIGVPDKKTLEVWKMSTISLQGKN